LRLPPTQHPDVALFVDLTSLVSHTANTSTRDTVGGSCYLDPIQAALRRANHSLSRELPHSKRT
jgi:hypothetical protein